MDVGATTAGGIVVRTDRGARRCAPDGVEWILLLLWLWLMLVAVMIRSIGRGRMMPAQGRPGSGRAHGKRRVIIIVEDRDPSSLHGRL